MICANVRHAWNDRFEVHWCIRYEASEEEMGVALGLPMEEIQALIAEAAETTPDVRADGVEMNDPEYVTAYLLNIIIPLLRENNQRIEEQLCAVGVVIPDMQPPAEEPPPT
jgi:hypothetical protein